MSGNLGSKRTLLAPDDRAGKAPLSLGERRAAGADRRRNLVLTPQYAALVAVIIEQRERQGLSQRDLARRLGKSNSHVSMIENCQRRVDVMELYAIAQSLGVPPVDLFRIIAERITTVTNRDPAGDLSA